MAPAKTAHENGLSFLEPQDELLALGAPRATERGFGCVNCCAVPVSEIVWWAPRMLELPCAIR